MKIERKEGYISVIAPKLMRWSSYIIYGNEAAKTARAAAFFPFIIFRDETQVVPWVINHERIHFRQQTDLLFVGAWILWGIEWVYARCVLRKDWKEAYLLGSGEQEAYRNQQDFDYLKHRKPFAQLWYLTHKREFTFGKPGEIIYTDKEGVDYHIT